MTITRADTGDESLRAANGGVSDSGLVGYDAVAAGAGDAADELLEVTDPLELDDDELAVDELDDEEFVAWLVDLRLSVT